MTVRETFANNTEKFEELIQQQKQEDAKRFLHTIAIPEAEKTSRTSSTRQFCFSIPTTIDFVTVAEMLATEPYGFDIKAYEKDRQILIKW